MSYRFYSTLTTDNTKVSGSGNFTNFHVLVKGTYDGTGGEPDLRVKGSGGNILHTDATGGISGSLTVPADLAFFDDVNQTTEYDYEVVKYVTTTGEFVAWVEVPSLLYDTDTVFYMHYSDSKITTSQENIAGMWGDYHAVYHGTSFKDSSSNGYDLTTNFNDPVANETTITKMAGSLDFTPGSSYASHESTDTIAGAISLQGWYYSKTSGAGQAICSLHNSSGTDVVRLTFQDNVGGDPLRGQMVDTTGTGNSNYSDTTTGGGYTTWYFGAVSINSSGHPTTTLDATASATTTTNNLTYSNTSAHLMMGHWRNGGSYLQHIDGYVEEVRYYNGELSADWITTDYNNQNAPDTFYTMGSEVDGSPITVDIANISSEIAASQFSPKTWSHTCAAGVKMLVVVITIYDASATDGDVSGVKYDNVALTEGTLTYESVTDGHVSIWYLSEPTTGSSELVSVTFGGFITDFAAGAVGIISSGTLEVDSTATPAVDTGHPTITWSTIAEESIAFGCMVDDQPVGTKVTPDNEEIYNADIGSDSAGASYQVLSSSGSQSISWTDTDNSYPYVGVGMAFKESGGAPATAVKDLLGGFIPPAR